MTFSEVRIALETNFTNGWTGTSYIAYQNMPSEVPEDYWVKVVCIYTTADNASIGVKSNAHLIRKHGWLIVQIYGPKNKGTGQLLVLADEALLLMQNKRFSNLFLYAGDVETIGEGPFTLNQEGGRDGDITGFYQINVKIPFEAY